MKIESRLARLRFIPQLLKHEAVMLSFLTRKSGSEVEVWQGYRCSSDTRTLGFALADLMSREEYWDEFYEWQDTPQPKINYVARMRCVLLALVMSAGLLWWFW